MIHEVRITEISIDFSARAAITIKAVSMDLIGDTRAFSGPCVLLTDEEAEYCLKRIRERISEATRMERDIRETMRKDRP